MTALLASAVIAAIAAGAAVVDFLYMRIPNAVPIALVAVFALLVAPALPWSEVAARLGVMGAVFAIGLGLYACAILGAGDVKYLAAAALLVPSSPVTVATWLSLVAVAGLPILALHRLAGWAGCAGRFPSFSEPGFFPYGPAISAGLIGILTLTGGPLEPGGAP